MNILRSALNNLFNNNLIKKNYLFLLIIFFLFSRLIVYSFFEIKINDPNYGYHLLDISLLQNDLFSSLFYLHAQPLLWNLFNGIIVKIFNSNIELISIFFNIYHYLLSLLIIYICIKILREFYKNKRIELFIFFFISLNPSIIFFENIFSYAHTTLFFFTLITYNIIKFFKSSDFKSELYIYINLLILSMTWVLFQPILLLLIFFLIRFLTKTSKKIIISFFIIFLISLVPMIKNKLIFDTFMFSTKSGQDFGTVFYDWQEYCGHPIKDQDHFTKKYFEKYNKSFDHQSLVGEKSKFNNIGMIVLGKECLKITINRILDQPLEYIESRTKAFLASHGKFAFDYTYPNPSGWEKYYKYLDDLYKNQKIKLFRQIFIFSIMIYIYFTILNFIISKKNEVKLRKGLFLSFILYAYLLLVGTLAAGTEQERILYTGFVTNILFFIIFFKNLTVKSKID